ncbi:hypothetical protein A4A49_35857 [Nicotiana attenuata]|uniref:Transmembrane protein n=1 Tax=Nicotiana attenuata TaxID=49451 RepID=A0A314KP46_NICAT|nr:hypothetical protein A4A49_35857 [Nicotiana attenuata]
MDCDNHRPEPTYGNLHTTKTHRRFQTSVKHPCFRLSEISNLSYARSLTLLICVTMCVLVVVGVGEGEEESSGEEWSYVE